MVIYIDLVKYLLRYFFSYMIELLNKLILASATVAAVMSVIHHSFWSNTLTGKVLCLTSDNVRFLRPGHRLAQGVHSNWAVTH